MKVFIAVLILIFSLQSWTKADDISDFEIEGMSVGDSLLNFANEKMIKSSISILQYPNDKYTLYEADKYIQTKNYDYISATTLKNDKDYIVTSISGKINYNDLEKCLKLKSEIQNDIEGIITYDDKEEVEYPIENNDGTVHGVQYYLKPHPSNEAIVINCYDFTEESGRVKNLSVSANSQNFAYFLINEAYK